MKLPSIHQIADEAGHSLARFPLVLINAAVGTAAAIMLIDYEGPAGASVLFKLMFAAILGIPLLFGLSQFAEKKKWKKLPSIGLQGLGILGLVLYALTVPSFMPNAPGLHTIRLLVLAIGLTFFVSVAPFFGRNELNGFWHYNKTLFFRLLTSISYAIVFFAGFSFALAALDNLFGIHIPGKRYGELAVLMLGVFNTWFFLAGVPRDLDALERSTAYPKGLKIFAQYILSPLVLVYLVILYAYLAKILIDWNWPQGWVSKLILGFSATGLFTLLLLYPVRDLTENKWIRLAWRWFFYILIPLLIMLPLAVWRRVSQYGYTEGRYLALVLGGWLIVMVCYFLIAKGKNIKLISTTLCAVALLVSFGPWSVFKVSSGSQIARLHMLLNRNSILVNDHVQKATTKPNKDDSRQISSILAYLHDLHGYQRIQPWFQTTLYKDAKGEESGCKNPADVSGMLGIEYMQGWMVRGAKDVDMSANQSGILPVQGYDYVVRATYFNKDQIRKNFPEENISYRFSTDLDTLTFLHRAKQGAADSIQLRLLPSLGQLLQEYGETNPQSIPCEKMCIRAQSSTMKIMIYVRYVHIRREGEAIKPTSYNADLFFSILD
jgi:hypothetical protein